jgi:tetratricopeptide (TPR) repeat protein
LAELLLRDDIPQLEGRLAASPASAEKTAFEGEVAYRKGRFEEAERLYRSALQRNEKTARAHFGLGKLALAKMKGAEAEKAFKRAISLDGKEPIYRFYLSDALSLEDKAKEAEKQLKEYLKLKPNDADRVPMAQAALNVFTAFRGLEMGAIDAPAQPAPVRLDSMLNLLFAEVSVNGQGPFRFLVDTGATQTVLSQKLATQLGLPRIASNIMHGVGGEGRLDSGVYRVDSLKLGDVTIKNLPLGTVDNPLLNQVLDGIIGTATFSDFFITVDYPQRRLELSRKLPAAAGTPVPVWCFSGLLLAPVEVNGKIRANLLIDTGADNTLLSHALAAELGVNKDTPGARLEFPIGGVGGLDDGVLMVPDVTLKSAIDTKTYDVLLALDLKDMSALLQTELSGVLGYDSLKDYRVTIDYSKAEIRLSK